MKHLFFLLGLFCASILFFSISCNIVYKALEHRFNLPPIAVMEWYMISSTLFIGFLYFIHALRVFLRVLDDKKEN